MILNKYRWVFCALVLASCGSKSDSDQEVLFEKMDSEVTGIDFTNIVPENDTLNQYSYHYLFNGSGVAVGDINNDGLPDLYFTGNSTSSKLYLNKGDFKFEDITEKAGVATTHWMSGVSMADVNNDGYLDIYVCSSGPSSNNDDKRNLLFINNKNNTFTESAKNWGVDDPGNATTASFFDMDNDGDLDFYLGNHADKYFSDVNVPFNRTLMMDVHNQQHLFRNDGGKFIDISEAAGVKAMGYCLSALPGDFNGDGFTDLYICNDYHIPDYFYLNQGNGTFLEANAKCFKHTSNNSMGSDAADVNNDGKLDLITLDMLADNPRRFMTLMGPKDYDFVHVAEKNGYGKQYVHNALQINRGKGMFSDMAFQYGVAKSDWSWSPLFSDFNDDGFVDLFVTNGYYRDVTNLDFVMYQSRIQQQTGKYVSHKEILEKLPFEKLQNFLYINQEGKQFKNEAANIGLDDATLSTGSAIGDLDGDGDIDLVLCNQGDKPFLYQNIKKSGNFVNFKFVSKTHKTGIGVQVIVESDSGIRIFENQTAKGYQSCSEALVHVGFNENHPPKKITFVLGNGASHSITDFNKNKTMEISLDDFNEKLGYLVLQGLYNNPTGQFSDISATSGINFLHQEQEDPDFKREPLIPHRYTMLGAGISATADCNGDNIPDIFMGNARKSGGSVLYFGSTSGKFIKAPSQPWSNLPADVTGTLFFDADNDQDQDLLVCQGGSEFDWPSANYKQQLYINDGKGRFTNESHRIKPDALTSAGSASAGDFDNDGDLDLFITGRVMPGMYPQFMIRSYLLQNNGGNFTDATAKFAPDLESPAMLTQGLFVDYNNDNWQDLVIVGENTPIVFMKNNHGKFTNATSEAGTGSYSGWFNSILPIDIDNDGDLDFIFGNKGVNSYLKATASEPISIYWADVDKNGREDVFLGAMHEGKEYPVYQVDEMALSFPGFISKKYTTYSAIGGKSMEEIFGQELLSQHKLMANEFQSLIAINNGSSFTVSALPWDCQSAPITGLISMDINNDGFDDVIGIGNNRYTRPTHGPDDALNGFVLMNHQGNLKYVDGLTCGFYVPGDGRGLAWLQSPQGIVVAAQQNNANAATFLVNSLKNNRVMMAKNASKAMVELNNGQTKQVYVGYGSGYMSSSMRAVIANPLVKSVIFYDKDGKLIK